MNKAIAVSIFLAAITTAGFGAGKTYGEIAFNKWCQNCHGINGDKYGGGKSSKIAFLEKNEIIKALKDYRSGKRNIHGMGQVMKSEVLKLKDDEIESVADYVVSLRPKAVK
jgi:cytochrome c553